MTTATCLDVLPDILTVFLPGYEASSWQGAGVPTNTPTEIVTKLTRDRSWTVDPKIKARLGDLGSLPMLMSPADFGKLITEDTEKWGKVVKFANIKPA